MKTMQKTTLLLAAAAAAVFSVGSAVSAATLMVDYKAANYNPTTGVWTDSSGNGNNATQTTVGDVPTLSTNATPNGSSAVTFNGTSDLLNLTTQLVEFGNSSGAYAGYTELAFLAPSASSGAISGGGYKSFEYRLGAGKQEVCLDYYSNDIASSNTALPLNTFSAVGVAATSTGNTMTGSFTLSGGADGSFSSSNHLWSSGIVDIGGSYGDSYFAGSIAELQIYEGVLTSSQIASAEQGFANTYAPEPTALGLLAAAGLGLLLLKRRKNVAL